MTKPVSNETVEQQLGWRYATKLFDPSKIIPESDWQTLERTLVLTPSSFGLQPWQFHVVTNPEVKARLRPASWNQSQITDASHIVVFAIKKDLSVAEIDRFIARTAEVRSVPAASLEKFRQMLIRSLESASFDINEWATRQVYIALGFFMATAALMGIDTCPIEGFEPQKYDEILGLPSLGYGSCVVAAAGYRSEADKYATVPKVRYKHEDVIRRI